jgi:glycosyltransferase involved in cell wall biosynthesis
MKLLWIKTSLDPTEGGPVTAISQLIAKLSELGHPSELVTLDTGNTKWVLEFPGTVHALGPSWGKYRYNSQLIGWLRKNAPRFDAVIVSGIWQFPSFATWLASRKTNFSYFVFTHGMLDPWFRSAYPLKHLKKWLYWPWAEYRVLRDAKAVLFTSEDEKRLAPQSFELYKANEVVVNYGIQNPTGDPDYQRNLFFRTYPELVGKRLILFLSRIDQKKGCDLLLNAFAEIASQHPDFHLIMVGPDQKNLQASLIAQAHQLALDEKITWTGMLGGDLKWGAFRSSEVFILPSHSENFGIVVAEALACGLPVLTTNKVNIWHEVADSKAGFVENDTLEGVRQLLDNWIKLTEQERTAMGENAKMCFQQHFELDMVAKNLITTLKQYL